LSYLQIHHQLLESLINGIIWPTRSPGKNVPSVIHHDRDAGPGKASAFVNLVQNVSAPGERQ
jgi:hypothetical protein